MSAYSLKAHREYLGTLIRRYFFRVLIAAYAFFVFFGVMPKAPPRAPYQSQFDYLIDTVTRSLGGFVVLAVLLAIVCAVWAGVAALRGSEPPAPSVPDEARDRGPL